MQIQGPRRLRLQPAARYGESHWWKEHAQDGCVDVQQGRCVQRVKVAIRKLTPYDTRRLFDEVAFVRRVEADADQHQLCTEHEHQAKQDGKLLTLPTGASLARGGRRHI